MTTQFTIIREEYNSITYESIVTIHTCLGDFTGRTVADEIDSQYPSMHNGNAIALNKALQKFAKAAIRQAKAQVQAIRPLIDAWGLASPANDEDPYRDVYNYQYRQFRNAEATLRLWTDRLANLQKTIMRRVEVRDSLVKAYLEKDKKD